MDVTLCLTHDCNLDCSYCYAGHKHKKVMTWETAERALAFSFDHAAQEVQLGFFGGEPLLEWALLQRSTERVQALAVERNAMGMTTAAAEKYRFVEEALAQARQHGINLTPGTLNNRSQRITRNDDIGIPTIWFGARCIRINGLLHKNICRLNYGSLGYHFNKR